jgi:ribonuclease HI
MGLSTSILTENINLISSLSLRKIGDMSKQKIDIFCDGAASNNGRATAKAGYGVAVLIDQIPATKYAVRLQLDEAQTNQRAELQALYHALRIIDQKQARITIYTDSMYAINCISVWAKSWRAKGWKKADGKPVLHLDIIEPMINLYEKNKSIISLKHVRGHQKAGTSYEADGNSLADELAVLSLNSSPLLTQMAIKE